MNRLVNILTEIRDRSCVVEAPLKSVLDNDKSEFTEARQLLARVRI